MDITRSHAATKQIRTPLFVLPDVENLSLAATTDNSFTVTWERPQKNFDYYLIDVSDDIDSGMANSRKEIVGSCANGTIIHRDITEVTCLQLRTCSNLRFRIRTHSNGPPERTSYGATLSGILIPASALPEVRNLRLVSVADRAVTLAWDKPRTQFDYYCIGTAAAREGQHQNTTPRTVSSCENSTIIHPYQNEATYGNLQACVNVNLKVQIYRKGPPELLSLATILQNVFIPGQDLDSPRNIRIDTQAHGSTVLRWDQPVKVDGALGEYIVKICNCYKACVPTDAMSNCKEYRTSSPMLEIKDTPAAYCVLVKATSKCGAGVLESLPSTKEVMTPSTS
ncbi:hypothetical protein MTO96_040479 [Rhipicephalus appendiculatus]